MESAVIGSDDPEPDPVTLTVILPLMIPVNPGALAVIGMLVQGATEVMSPVLLTVTAPGVELVQVTSFVMSLVVAGWLPWV
jgi:hypothetical protein